MDSKKRRYNLLLLPVILGVIAPNSLIIVAISSNHYLAEDPRINNKTIAFVKVVITYLEKRHMEDISEERFSDLL
ncbi:MAG: hypothetical protein LC541_11990 [Candidatus Thiodiazotropha sp.]|nr:hypothetical protein [Candidatus Thiodiazotropha sp.]MCU7801632.1 hypothetical protein [Candidatus Thiodiazotropha sp. (ex Lucinoma borealis)]MCU7840444.1 hypothetical protein [Candidatus Thiodiazotropha sp. (ex Troendleina suluensis)]MCU7882651.1 hypothetical protein [Candidatus Thiodiazotropha sp. (ex Lucinoma annulata)]MCM8883992.1 hypothetical protein [Candidatus Thiodiazotropha sp.]